MLALTLAVSGGVVFSAVPVRRNQNDDGDREGPEEALAAAVLAAAGPLFAHGSKPDWPKMRQRREASVCPSTGAAIGRSSLACFACMHAMLAIALAILAMAS